MQKRPSSTLQNQWWRRLIKNWFSGGQQAESEHHRDPKGMLGLLCVSFPRSLERKDLQGFSSAEAHTYNRLFVFYESDGTILSSTLVNMAWAAFAVMIVSRWPGAFRRKREKLTRCSKRKVSGLLIRQSGTSLGSLAGLVCRPWGRDSELDDVAALHRNLEHDSRWQEQCSISSRPYHGPRNQSFTGMLFPQSPRDLSAVLSEAPA